MTLSCLPEHFERLYAAWFERCPFDVDLRKFEMKYNKLKYDIVKSHNPSIHKPTYANQKLNEYIIADNINPLSNRFLKKKPTWFWHQLQLTAYT